MLPGLAGRHIMLDSETWGVRPGCAIRSIGLVGFDFTGAMHISRYWNVDRASCERAGLHVDKGTAAYWAQQPAAAQAVFNHDQRALETALSELSTEITSMPFVATIWADGSHFDIPILTAAYEAVGRKAPWKAPQIRDARTLLATFAFDARDMPPPAEPRSAATRALFQAQCLVTCAHQASRVRGVTEPPKRSVFE